jgi:hypothetical protein
MLHVTFAPNTVLAIRIPVPHDAVVPLLIGLGVFVVAAFAFWRWAERDKSWTEWWRGPRAERGVDGIVRQVPYQRAADRFPSDARVTAMAQTIHEMSCLAHDANEVMGSPLHRMFTHHEMLRNYRRPPPGDPDQVHIFHMTDGQQGFSVMVHDGSDGRRGWVAVAPDGDYQGASVQSSTKGRYLVRIDRYSTRPAGPLARRFVEKFVTDYGAADASE